ncbi:DUF4474 domain-containing protein [Terrisporobacter sp.]
MKEILVIAVLVFIVILQFYIYRRSIKRKESVYNVLKETDREKIKSINNGLDEYGFYFEDSSDIIASKMYCWQRKMGYCKLYDELAPSLNMVIDCEPIYFNYNKRRWLIEFWKGQYGMTTGGEVGIYVTDKKDIDIPGFFTGPFYECVTDEERLDMKFTLIKEKGEIFNRQEHHWWLTGFDVGGFSEPSNLSMEIALEFPNSQMKKEFINGLKTAGYKDDDYKSINNSVYIKFDTPKSDQGDKHYKILLPYIQLMNKNFCNLYNYLTRDFNRTIDKIYFLYTYYPTLFKILSRDKELKQIEKVYKTIQSYLNEGGIDNE